MKGRVLVQEPKAVTLSSTHTTMHGRCLKDSARLLLLLSVSATAAGSGSPMIGADMVVGHVYDGVPLVSRPDCDQSAGAAAMASWLVTRHPVVPHAAAVCRLGTSR